MCGRKTLTKGKMEIIEQLSIQQWDETVPFAASYNIAPLQYNPVLVFATGRTVKPMRWGLIPAWTKTADRISYFINARVETLATKPAFAPLLVNHRCLVITDGYYEWLKSGPHKQPYFIHAPDNSLLLMAGLWDTWTSAEGQPISTYTVITTRADEQLSHIHERMPLILPGERINAWLDPTLKNRQDALALLRVGQTPLESYPVSTMVNSVKNNSPECIRRIVPESYQPLSSTGQLFN